MPSPMSMLCASCGFQNPPGMKFCGNCGTRLAAPPLSAPPEPTSTPPISSGSPLGTGPLRDRILQAGLEASGQRRNVTVLFADLSGYTRLAHELDGEDVYFLIQDYMKLLAENVFRYEGFVDKYMGDGMMALFGAPLAQESHAELAVRAALDMHTGLEAMNNEIERRLGVRLRMRIGLHSGSVIVGGVGSDLLMDYTAIGDTVNLASRLEQAARPGTILVSESVYHQTRPLFDFEAVTPLTLKGLENAVQAYQVIAARKAPGSLRGLEGLRPPMIGRAAELAKLAERVTALAKRGEGGFVLVTGEAGIGKSRLISETKTLAHSLPITIYEGFSLTYRRGVSFWMFRDLLRNALGLTPEASEAELRYRLESFSRKHLAGESSESLPYLEQLFDLTPSQPGMSTRLAMLEADQLRQRVFLTVRNLLLSLARQRPLMLIFEDLHWADETSLNLLGYLADILREAPILIVSISRPYEAGPLAQAAERARQRLGLRMVELPLQSLSLAESDQLLSNLLALPELPAGIRQQILQRAAGVPFYLEEILRMLIDRNIIRRERDTLQLVPGAAIEDLGVPETLEALILTRFDQVEPAARQVLQVAAAIGRRFSVPLITKVLEPVESGSLADLLHTLVEREFILPLPELPGVEYQFKHVLVSDAIYRTLLKRDRSRLHGQIGAALESLFAEHLDEQVELLARHYSWSNRLERALHYSILAGQKAARRNAPDQARQHFQSALDLLPKVEHTPEQAMHVRLGLGEVLLLAGDFPNARLHFLACLPGLQALPAERRARQASQVERRLANTFERQGDYDQALQRLQNAQQICSAAPVPDPVEAARILNEIGWINFRRGLIDEAEAALNEALLLVQASDQLDVIASIYNRLGGIYYQKDDLEQASQYVRKSLELRQMLDDTVAVARSYNNLGLLDWKRGEWESALQNFTRSYELASSLGDVESSIQLQANIGLLQTDRGELEEALERLESSLRAAQQIGHSYMQGMAYLHMSRYWLATSAWDKALENCALAQKTLADIGANENQVDILTSVGEARLGLNQLDAAEQACNQAQTLLQETGTKSLEPSLEQARILRLRGNLNGLRQDIPAALNQLTDSAAIFQQIGNLLEYARSLTALTALTRRVGDWQSARLYQQEARAIFNRLGARLDLQRLERTQPTP